jgi:hypothetical protein
MAGVGAPHNRVLDPFTQKGGVRKIKTLGSTAYLEAKAKRDNSMPLKRGMPESVYGIASQDPRDTVRAGLPEPQFPAMQSHISRPQRILGGTAGIWRIPILRQNLPAGRAVGNDPTEGNGRGTYLALEIRLTLRECGIAYGARALRRRSLRSSPRAGKPPTTRRREAGVTCGVLGEGGARDA